HDGDGAADIDARMRRFRSSTFLLDPGAGSGRTFHWSAGRGIGRAFFIAGGLTPGNVAESIRIIRPFGVDVSSGVEFTLRQKSREKMAAFIQAVRSCDEESDAG